MTDARTDWNSRIGIRTGVSFAGNAPELVAPDGLVAVAGGAQVTLDWKPVDGAVGYQVHVAESADGPWSELDHAGRDVLAVPHPPYVDTTGTPGEERWYAVASLSDVHVEGALSAPVSAVPLASAGTVTVSVDTGSDLGELDRPWRPMIGSEHLSHALSTDTTGGRVVGEELSTALRAAHEELGVTHVRAHGILCDDLAVYREVDDEPVHDFTGVDRVYDHIRSLGLYPVVEVSFMPHDLASDPSKTVFDYDAIVSPPKDWGRWHDLVRDLTAHLVERYGDEVVEHWSFEVWNEANLEVFWSGTPEEYLRLYDVTVAAVRAVDDRLVVGGPSSAAAGWVEELLAHAEETGVPVDFVSTHTYGSPPLDFRPTLARYGREGTPIWWTEWGVTPTHFNEVSDAVFAGTFLLRGMASSMGRIEALSYWVVSDHFEELGRPPALLHGGFGLRTVGELRKPRWWALAMLERLGPRRLATSLTGDGAGSLVEVISTRDTGITTLLWNLTLDQTKAAGSDELARDVRLEVTGLEPGATYQLVHERVDQLHSNVAAAWGRLREDGQDWPTEEQWAQLRAADRLEEAEPAGAFVADAAGTVSIELTLPMPAMSLLTLS
ncbi:xylan 1,4-beta-xylosidase [Nocardioides sp. Root1257]|uniref:GH39 family glycosyl hydrolase n=1 Tax=unclassified Nocardioides TaxID=2615069 RepID=UPI0006FB0231|nr:MULTISPECIES: glycosyl hydrolase [unclassified Nocardioides]KQW49088.1 xylan 1,4-beta-xylosidase [Nocardioides sp. Root1257]KRC48262.1 xylan 1,4-beta-xylosidase [Nocardioides sp. Root224]